MTSVEILAGRLLQQPRIDISKFDRIFIEEMVLDCAIGVYPEEQGVTQKVAFTIEAFVAPTVRARHDALSDLNGIGSHTPSPRSCDPPTINVHYHYTHMQSTRKPL